MVYSLHVVTLGLHSSVRGFHHFDIIYLCILFLLMLEFFYNFRFVPEYDHKLFSFHTFLYQFFYLQYLPCELFSCDKNRSQVKKNIHQLGLLELEE